MSVSDMDMQVMAKDFIAAFKETPEARIPPLEFMRRWTELGVKLKDVDAHEFLTVIMPNVVKLARELIQEGY